LLLCCALMLYRYFIALQFHLCANLCIHAAAPLAEVVVLCFGSSVLVVLSVSLIRCLTR
jgi:hypothetical protein